MKKQSVMTATLLCSLGPSIAMLLTGCSTPATHTDRVALIREEWGQMDEAINEYERKALAQCNGDQACINARLAEIMEMRRILLEWRQAAINGELETEREKELEWDDFIQGLAPTLRDLAEVIEKLIDLVRPSRIKASGVLNISNQLAVVVPNSNTSGNGNTGQSHTGTLPEQEAIDAGLSVLQEPGDIIPIYQTTLSGSVPTDIEIDDAIYNSQMDVGLKIRWDGNFDPSDQFTVESGNIKLFDGPAAIFFDVDTSVGASYGKIWDNNNGVIHLSGRIQFADPVSNTIKFGDKRVLSLPIELVDGQSVKIETNGFVSTSFMKPFYPSSVSDYDGNGVVEPADQVLFTSDFQAGNSWADTNGDGTLDYDDVNFFSEQFSEDYAHQTWCNTRMGL